MARCRGCSTPNVRCGGIEADWRAKIQGGRTAKKETNAGERLGSGLNSWDSRLRLCQSRNAPLPLITGSHTSKFLSTMQASELIEFFAHTIAAGESFTLAPKEIEENGKVLRITGVTIAPEAAENARAALLISVNKSPFIAAASVSAAAAPHARIDLMFTPIETVTFKVKGGAALHLSGYKQSLDNEEPLGDDEDMDEFDGQFSDEDDEDEDEEDANNEDDEDEDDEEDEDEEEDEEEAPALVPAGKQQQQQQQQQKRKAEDAPKTPQHAAQQHQNDSSKKQKSEPQQQQQGKGQTPKPQTPGAQHQHQHQQHNKPQTPKPQTPGAQQHQHQQHNKPQTPKPQTPGGQHGKPNTPGGKPQGLKSPHGKF
jgi:hypothetical protein